MNSLWINFLLGFNIAILTWNFFFMICLMVERNELLKEWKESRKEHE